MGLHSVIRRASAGLTACAAVLSWLVCPWGTYIARAEAEEAALRSTVAADYYSFSTETSSLPSFDDYHRLYSGEPRPDAEITVSGGDCSVDGEGLTVSSYEAEGVSRGNVLLWEKDGGRAVYDIYVPETGIYCLNMDYCPLETSRASVELSLDIDGDISYDTASRLTLGRAWVNGNDIYTDAKGNQVRPVQVQKEMWKSCFVGDTDGLFSQPLFFRLEQGDHKIGFTAERAGFVLAGFSFRQPEKIPYYSEYRSSVKADNDIAGTQSALFRIEGENASVKSDPTLCPTYDNTTYLVSPSDPRKLVYNTIGSGSWKKALQSVTWDIPAEDVGSGGWFRIGIKARQNTMRGFCSSRRLYIDGRVPFEEAECISFPYSKNWQVVSPETANGDSVYVYLGSGSHTLTLEAVPGEIGKPLRELEKSAADLNAYYRRILMITGASPDKYTDYYVHERIPELIDEFRRISGELKGIQKEIEGISGTKGSEAAVIEQVTVVLDKCVKSPLKIPSYLTRIKDSITALSGWMREYRDQPLEVDYIELASADRDFSGCKKELGKSLSFGLRAFIGSFFEDYTSMNDASGSEHIEVWVSLGRDQAQIVRELTESRFTEEYGIPVTVKLVSGGIVEAALAGEEPDAALFLGGEFPVNLAARGLLAEVSSMDGFEEVRGRFQKNAMTHYTYGGSVYGVPISQSFPMLFYRTEILGELGFDHPPETWSELIDMLPALQRNYMSAGLVLPPANISASTETGHTLALLLLQKGLSYYSGDMKSSALGETAAVQAFEQWTDFYRKYSFEQTYDAFSRFRTGEYPIVINNYTFANQLEAAAPEIKGTWDFCPVPGTEDADGSVSHAANSNGSGAVIFQSSKHKDAAWEFVKWFTSAEVQTEFGLRSEGLLGTLGRFDTANVEALGQLSWSSHALERIRAQQAELTEIPVTPASYTVTRNIMNAFREVINEAKNPRDTLLRYNLDINEEIERKLSSLGK